MCSENSSALSFYRIYAHTLTHSHILIYAHNYFNPIKICVLIFYLYNNHIYMYLNCGSFERKFITIIKIDFSC
jgi:hypothetical protein